MSRPPTDILTRLWNRVQRTDTCWLWTGATVEGYGVLHRGPTGRGNVRAHRVAYEALVGSVPEGMELDHLCRNPSCVNPAHLEPVTHAENVRRGEAGDRHNRLKTHCPQGHPYDQSNTRVKVVRGRVNRLCRSCVAAYDARRYAERKAIA